MELPQAVQLYSKSSSGKESVKRQGWCPEHPGKRSSKFLGPQPSLFDNEIFWSFICVNKDGHVFLNHPDPTAPQDVAGIEAWKTEQRLSWIKEKGLQ